MTPGTHWLDCKHYQHYHRPRVASCVMVTYVTSPHSLGPNLYSQFSRILRHTYLKQLKEYLYMQKCIAGNKMSNFSKFIWSPLSGFSLDEILVGIKWVGWRMLSVYYLFHRYVFWCGSAQNSEIMWGESNGEWVENFSSIKTSQGLTQEVMLN